MAPATPEGLDGVVYVGVGRRGESIAHVCRLQLPEASRKARQRSAAKEALEMLAEMLAMPTAEEWPTGIELAREEWSELIFGAIDAVCVGGREEERESESSRRLVYPGSFNPFHTGHERLAAWAAELAESAGESIEVEFEISIENVDKASLDLSEVIARLRQFDASVPVWLTRAATFAEKAELFPGATFIVGADTIARLGDLSYYPGGIGERSDALARIADCDCRFLVFGRAPTNDS